MSRPIRSSRFKALTRAIGFRSGLFVPMLREGAPIGVIAVARAEPGPFSDSEIELLKTFADQAVIAIENVRLFKELQARTGELTRSVEQLTALGEVSRAVSSTLDVETVLDTIVSRASQLAGADGCAIYEYDEATEAFHVARHAQHRRGARRDARGRRRSARAKGAMGRAAETREPIQIADIAAPGAYQSQLRDTLIGSGYRALLSVPLLREEQIIGSLSLNRKAPGEFPPEVVERPEDLRHPVGPGHPERPALPGDRGQEPAARGGQPAQVRVPRQHVPRAAHAAQRHHRVLGGAGRADVRGAEREAGRVPAGHPTRRASISCP